METCFPSPCLFTQKGSCQLISYVNTRATCCISCASFAETTRGGGWGRMHIYYQDSSYCMTTSTCIKMAFYSADLLIASPSSLPRLSDYEIR